VEGFPRIQKYAKLLQRNEFEKVVQYLRPSHGQFRIQGSVRVDPHRFYQMYRVNAYEKRRGPVDYYMLRQNRQCVRQGGCDGHQL